MDNCVILHVEDDDATAIIIRLALDQANITASVYRVSDGEQALLFLRKQFPYQDAQTPQFAIVDLNMPKIDGWELLNTCQTDPVLKLIPFIVMSTARASKVAARALNGGARYYIEKPETFDEFVQQLQTHYLVLLKEMQPEPVSPAVVYAPLER